MGSARLWTGFDGDLEQLPCHRCVADSGVTVDSEDDGKVQWVRSVGEYFLKLAIDAQPLDGGVEAETGHPEDRAYYSTEALGLASLLSQENHQPRASFILNWGRKHQLRGQKPG